MLNRIDKPTLEAANDLIILVSPECDWKPRPILRQSALVKPTLWVRFLYGLLLASQCSAPELVILRLFYHFVPHP